MKCPYCHKNAAREFHTDGYVVCTKCNEKLVREDGPEETPEYVKCQFCGYEPVPINGRNNTTCPHCGKLTF